MNEAFPGKYMRADDLDGQDLNLSIRDVAMEEFTDQQTKRADQKPVIHWRQKDAKPLVLNKTNWSTISKVLGTDETDEWQGQSITLYPAEVEAFGEMTAAIRVRLKKPQPVQRAAAAGAGTGNGAPSAKAALARAPRDEEWEPEPPPAHAQHGARPPANRPPSRQATEEDVVPF